MIPKYWWAKKERTNRINALGGLGKKTEHFNENTVQTIQQMRENNIGRFIWLASFHLCVCSSCGNVTDIGVGYVSTMLSLTSLFLRWCTQLRDFGLQHLCSMRNLQILSLAGNVLHYNRIIIRFHLLFYCILCSNTIHLSSPTHIQQQQHQQRREPPQWNTFIPFLSTGCPLLTSSGLSTMIQLRHLQELELTNCPGGSQELYEYLREHMPRCSIIE